MFNRGKGIPGGDEISDSPTTVGPDPQQADTTTVAGVAAPEAGAGFGPEEVTALDAGTEAEGSASSADDPAGPAVSSGVAPEAVPSEVTGGVEEMLLRLEGLTAAGEAPSSDVWNRLTDDASSHAEILQGTLDAQKQAQRMLALATKLRGDASVQAEQILQEARAAATRLRQDSARESERAREQIASWASARRQEIEGAVADLLRAANADAERIRTEAERTAMERAEETARRYVQQVSDAAEREAESTRAQARLYCEQSAIAVNDMQESVQQLAESVASFLVTSHRHGAQLTAIADKAAAAARAPVAPEPERMGGLTAPVQAPEQEMADSAEHPAQYGTDDALTAPGAEAPGVDQASTPTSLPLGSLFRPRDWDQ